MKKRVFLLAVSCKNGGLCPGGGTSDAIANYTVRGKRVPFQIWLLGRAAESLFLDA